MILSPIFAAARARIAAGMTAPRLFRAQDWTPGPTYGRERPQTFGERRAAYASIIEDVRRGELAQRYHRQRALIIAESPEARGLIAAVQMLDNLPFGMSLEREAAPMRAKLETIIAGKIAAQQGANDAGR
jgi:hypothetical protein